MCQRMRSRVNALMEDPVSVQIVRLAMTRLGLEEREKAAFAERLNMPPYSTPQSLVTKWLRGLNEPGFVYTMSMLNAAGLLQPEAVAAWEGVSLEEARRRVDAARRRAAGLEARSAEETAADLAARARSPRGRRRSA